MHSIRSPRHTPAVLVAAVALVVALAGTALAGPDAMTSAVKKSKVKAIAKKQADKRITKRGPGLSVADSAALGGVPANGYARVASEPWHDIDSPGEPEFENTWAVYAGGPGKVSFYKDPIGVVRLRGSVISSGASTERQMFTLPPGYRPGQGATFLARRAGTQETASVAVGADGGVAGICEPQIACAATLDGISFRAE